MKEKEEVKELSINQFNTILSDVYTNNHKALGKVIENDVPYGYHSEKNQGEYGERKAIIKLDEKTYGPDLYVKIIYNTDSYGNEEFIAGVKITKPVTKTITSYE